METNKFKCKDEVIYRFKGGPGLGEPEPWIYGIFSHYKKEGDIVINGNCYQRRIMDILPYEGNEELVGKTDEPDEEVKLKEGEWLMVGNLINSSLPEEWMLREYCRMNTDNIETFNNSSCEFQHWPCAIKFSNFNPNDMEETRKHILCVKKGKIIRYKG